MQQSVQIHAVTRVHRQIAVTRSLSVCVSFLRYQGPGGRTNRKQKKEGQGGPGGWREWEGIEGRTVHSVVHLPRKSTQGSHQMINCHEALLATEIGRVSRSLDRDRHSASYAMRVQGDDLED